MYKPSISSALTPDPRTLNPEFYSSPTPDPRIPTPASPDPRIPTPAFASRLSPHAPRRYSRSAFTLVELLMVIAIIGMLTALVSVAAVKAINSGRNAQISTEISLLDGAIQNYKNNVGGSYPPDSSVLSATTAVQDRKNRMLQHLRKAFPRVVVAGGYDGNSGNPPPPGTFQYLVQKAFAYHDAFPPTGPNAPPAVPYGTKPPAGNTISGIVWGDLNNLDPAEAWVFWMGGMPSPPIDSNTGQLWQPGVSTGKALYQLVGFSASKVGNAAQNGSTGYPVSFGPFSLTDNSRDMGPYEFQFSRLGDADGDGWLDYYPPYGDVPQPPGSLVPVSNPMPPYVYFDSTSYGGSLSSGTTTTYPVSAAYPSASGSGLQPTGFLQWGVAVPYAQTPAGANATAVWANPQKFQIICAGLDQMYWFDASGTLSNITLRYYPSGRNYSQGDLDNLTNISSGMLQSAMP